VSGQRARLGQGVSDRDAGGSITTTYASPQQLHRQLHIDSGTNGNFFLDSSFTTGAAGVHAERNTDFVLSALSAKVDSRQPSAAGQGTSSEG